MSRSSAALLANLRALRGHAPAARQFAVIKAEAYGHGLNWAAGVLADAIGGAHGGDGHAPPCDGLAVSCVEEACVLRDAGVEAPVLVLQGARDAADWRAIATLGLQAVVHDPAQVATLAASGASGPSGRLPARVWIKVDTGMHRLGFAPEAVPGVIAELLSRAPSLGLMTHFACADTPAHPLNHAQRERFSAAWAQARCSAGAALVGWSTDNSAAILGGGFAPDAWAKDDGLRDGPRNGARDGTLPAERWNRPGIAVYGASPFGHVDANASDGPSAALADHASALRPVMTLRAPVIAVKPLTPGDAVGYGATWSAPRAGRMAVIAIGYADGYPRHAPSGTPVLIHGERARLIGRVSMDLIAVDITDLVAPVAVGDWATLWGEGLPVDEIATAAGTIGYELLTRVHGRVRCEESA